jgi:putative holliday junction resolvase
VIPATRTLLGFDYGEKRIGVAVGQTLTATATPLTTIPVVNHKPDWTAITDLIETWQPDALIVGIPLTMDDETQLLTRLASRFARQLEGRYHLPVYGVDERLSSHEAQQRIRSSYNVDPVAAQVILETWLGEQRNNPDPKPRSSN